LVAGETGNSGVIYLRGSVEGYQLYREVGAAGLEEVDDWILKTLFF
jgi:hypothetical protein